MHTLKVAAASYYPTINDEMFIFSLISYVSSVLTNSLPYIDATRFKREHLRRLELINKRSTNINKIIGSTKHEKSVYQRRRNDYKISVLSLGKTIDLLFKQQKFARRLIVYFMAEIYYTSRITLLAIYFSLYSMSNFDKLQLNHTKVTANTSLDYLTEHQVINFGEPDTSFSKYLLLKNPYSDTGQPHIFCFILIGIMAPCFACRYLNLYRMLALSYKNELEYIRINTHALNYSYLAKLPVSIKCGFVLVTKYLTKSFDLTHDSKGIRLIADVPKQYKEMSPALPLIDKYYYLNQFDYDKQFEGWLGTDQLELTGFMLKIEEIKAKLMVMTREIARVLIGMAKNREAYCAYPFHRCSPHTLARLIIYAAVFGAWGNGIASAYGISIFIIKESNLKCYDSRKPRSLQVIYESALCIIDRSDKLTLLLHFTDHVAILFYFLTHLIEVDGFIYSNVVNFGRLQEVSRAMTLLLQKCESQIVKESDSSGGDVNKNNTNIFDFRSAHTIPKNHRQSLQGSFFESKYLYPNDNSKENDYMYTGKSYPIPSPSINEIDSNYFQGGLKIKPTYIVLPKSKFNLKLNNNNRQIFKSAKFVEDININLKITIDWMRACMIELDDMKEQYTFLMNVTGLSSVFIISYMISLLTAISKFSPAEWILLGGIAFSYLKSIVSIFMTGIEIEGEVSICINETCLNLSSKSFTILTTSKT